MYHIDVVVGIAGGLGGEGKFFNVPLSIATDVEGPGDSLKGVLFLILEDSESREAADEA